MTDPDEIRQTIAGLADIFDALSIRWAVGGSIASAVHGEPRATNDVDIITVLSEEAARALIAQLGSAYYADVDAALDAVRRHSSFNIIDNRTFIKVDIFVPDGGPMGTGQLDRRIVLDVFPGVRPIPVLGPEDTLLQKLRWYALGGGVSDRQWRDIVSVLRSARAQLDDSYLDDVAKAGDLTALLERAREDAQKR